jgi:hypothetical protein
MLGLDVVVIEGAGSEYRDLTMDYHKETQVSNVSSGL